MVTVSVSVSVSPSRNPKLNSRGSNFHNPKRPPLLPSNNAPPPPRRPRPVESRYLSSSSPITPAPARRAQSVERRRTPRTPTPEASTAARLLMKSTRSLSVSFQGESYKLPVSNAKPAPAPAPAPVNSVRRGTPERRKVNTAVKDQREDVKIGDQYRWPGRSKEVNSSVLNRSLDYGADKCKLVGSGNGIKDLENSVIKSKRECKSNGELTRADSASISGKSGGCEISDSDSVSSGSTLGGSVARAREGLRGIVVPARFLQESNSRLREEVDPSFGTPKSKNNDSKIKSSSTPTGTKRHLPETPVSVSKAGSVSGRFTSPSRGATRLASISKGLFTSVNSPSPRGRPSPARNGKPDISHDIGTPSILSFTADMRKVRVGENRVDDAHELRMLYHRQSQWRFINARAEAALLLQSGTAEAPCLESWCLIVSDHCISLSEARQALQTSIANLPLVDGATADIQLLKDTMCSAADVMQGMSLSVGSHITMVEQVSLLASELANTTANEIALVEQGKNLLSALASIQVNECSLKTHILQLPCEASSLAAQV